MLTLYYIVSRCFPLFSVYNRLGRSGAKPALIPIFEILRISVAHLNTELYLVSRAKELRFLFPLSCNRTRNLRVYTPIPMQLPHNDLYC